MDQQLREPVLDEGPAEYSNHNFSQENKYDTKLLDTEKQNLYNQRQQLRENVRVGKQYEETNIKKIFYYFPFLRSEITLKMPSGIRFRADSIGRTEDGTNVIFEFKSSLNPRLSKNQREGFRELQTQAAVVVGRGKAGFEGGTVIPSIADGTRIVIKSPRGTTLIGQELDDSLWSRLQ